MCREKIRNPRPVDFQVIEAPAAPYIDDSESESESSEDESEDECDQSYNPTHYDRTRLPTISDLRRSVRRRIA
jgi:hypothetical protein